MKWKSPKRSSLDSMSTKTIGSLAKNYRKAKPEKSSNGSIALETTNGIPMNSKSYYALLATVAISWSLSKRAEMVYSMKLIALHGNAVTPHTSPRLSSVANASTS